MSMLLASLDSVGVVRRDRWLIRDVGFTLRKGEIISLIGPNGAGKSTVSKVLSGLIKPDVGTVEKSPDITIGYVPQRANIAATMPMTVRRLMKLSRPCDDREIEAALEEINIKALADCPVQRLSGGEFQRALLARALLRKPDLLILDEPAQGLDIHGEAKLYGQIMEVRDRLDCGVLLICHNLHMVMAQTDTVICLNSHVCCSGTPEQVVNNREFVRLFGGDVARSHALYHHQHDHSHQIDGSIRFSQAPREDVHMSSER